MPRYSVTVEFTGDYDVEADTPEEAEAYVQQIWDIAGPDSDWYYKIVHEVREEDE